MVKSRRDMHMKKVQYALHHAHNSVPMNRTEPNFRPCSSSVHQNSVQVQFGSIKQRSVQVQFKFKIFSSGSVQVRFKVHEQVQSSIM